LKIDTEDGGDLNVLSGSESILSTSGVDIIAVEARMNNDF